MSATNSQEFAVDVQVSKPAILAVFTGNADLRALEPLEQQLRALHASAIQHRVAAVRVDLRKLEFMNSSCFKCFITWLALVQELPDEEHYRIVFMSNGQMHWQRRSLEALRCFAIDLVSIEVEG
jgi:hypothetical protein